MRKKPKKRSKGSGASNFDFSDPSEQLTQQLLATIGNSDIDTTVVSLITVLLHITAEYAGPEGFCEGVRWLQFNVNNILDKAVDALPGELYKHTGLH
ncbi:MAG TPA: hypothetical protein VGJ20_16635 [Xanthobacteraceae bacterium]|jgi:hypothetical protein